MLTLKRLQRVRPSADQPQIEAIREAFVKRTFATEGISATEVQARIDQVWASISEEADLRQRASELGYDLSQSGNACPFEARPTREAFTAVELILIAASGRVVGGLAEKALGQLWDQIVWPRLRPLVGRQLKPHKDADQ